MRMIDRYRSWRRTAGKRIRGADVGPIVGSGAPGCEPKTEKHVAWAAAWARTFDAVLELYHRPDGSLWTGEEVEHAAGGQVEAAYFDALLHGRVYAPSEDRLKAIARAVGLPAKLLGREVSWWEGVRAAHRKGVALKVAIRRMEAERDAERIGRIARELFDRVPNQGTRRPYTDEEAALASGGHIEAQEVRAIREGLVPDPPRGHLLALCDAFDVDPSFWKREPDQPGKLPVSLDPVRSGAVYSMHLKANEFDDLLLGYKKEKVVLVPE